MDIDTWFVRKHTDLGRLMEEVADSITDLEEENRKLNEANYTLEGQVDSLEWEREVLQSRVDELEDTVRDLQRRLDGAEC